MYKTSDLGLATALRVNGVKFVGIEPSVHRPHIADFLFEDSPKIEEVVGQYNQSSLTVNAKWYAQEMKNLRAQMKKFFDSQRDEDYKTAR